ncbi:MAG: asparagine synthase C-terminal domain-containing protein, partial [Chloroflexota bacterium]
TMTAAAILKKSGERLPAFTSIPYYEQSANIFSNRFGNELPYARASARQAGNVDLFTIDAAQISPIQSIRHSLEIHNEPAHAAGNFFWIQALQEKARDDGLRVLLTGQLGNAGLSWTGDKFSQSLLFQLRHMAINIWTKELLKRNLPARLLENIKSQKASADWFLSSSINPDLAGRLNLHKLRLQDPVETPRTALEQRFQLLKPGNNFVGAIHAQNGAAFGLDVRDPSGDVRLLEFSLSVPDKVFIDPKTGIDRWLIRAAMEGRLPDEVRLNRRRGLQAADIIPRLRACAAEVDEALSEIDHGIGRNFVNVPNMRQIWQMVQTVETPKVSIKAQTVLTRGIMAGLWVNSNFA